MDNYTKHSGKASQDFLKANILNIFQWPSLLPDVIPIEQFYVVSIDKTEGRTPLEQAAVKGGYSGGNSEYHDVTQEVTYL